MEKRIDENELYLENNGANEWCLCKKMEQKKEYKI